MSGGIRPSAERNTDIDTHTVGTAEREKRIGGGDDGGRGTGGVKLKSFAKYNIILCSVHVKLNYKWSGHDDNYDIEDTHTHTRYERAKKNYIYFTEYQMGHQFGHIILITRSQIKRQF